MSSSATDYDCLVIGGGLSGLLCGITCLSHGLSCAVISSGMSALHFSSGSIDMLGYDSKGELVRSPLCALPGFLEKNPDHPYGICGLETITEAFSLLRTELAKANLYIHSNGELNHFHVTAAGTLKPTYFSQQSVFNKDMATILEEGPSITIMSVKGFADFSPQIVASNIKRHKLFSRCKIRCAEITLPELEKRSGPVYPLRSIDIARVVDSAPDIKEIADRIDAAARGSEIAAMPAFLGIERYNDTVSELRRLTGRMIYEIPTLPPSILGMRIDNALKSRFAAMGGVFIAGETVERGIIENGRVVYVHTRNQNDTISARSFVLATGSFFSGGIASGYGKMWEPVFGLSLSDTPDIQDVASELFFDPKGHRFLSVGVKTDNLLRPFTRSGQTVENLFSAGAVLAGYNPVAQGCGGGVALATGYFAAKQAVRYMRA